MNDNEHGETPHENGELVDEQDGGNSISRRNVMKGIGAAGVAGATGTAGIATQTKQVEGAVVSGTALAILAIGGVVGVGLEGRYNFLGEDPAVAASETSDISLRENQKYILGQTYGRGHQKVLNEAVNFDPNGSSVAVDMKGEYANSIRTKTLESISESFTAGVNKQEAYNNIKQTHQEFIAKVERRVLDNWNFIAQRQQRQIHQIWQKVSADPNSNQQVFTNTNYDPFDFTIYPAYDEQNEDSMLSPSDTSPHGEYVLANGETYTCEPFIFKTGTVTEGKDTNIVSPLKNDAYESVARDSQKSVEWSHEPTGTVVNDTPQNNMTTLENVLLTDGTHDRTPKNQFGTLASSVEPILKVTLTEEIEDPSVTTSVVDNIRSFRLFRRMIPVFEKMVDSELETFDPEKSSFLDDLYVAMENGKLDPNDLLTREEFSTRTAVESIATSDRIYYGMDWSANTVNVDITRQDDSTVSYSGLMTLSLDNYIVEATVNNGVPQLPSDSDLKREIDDHIESEEPIEAEVYIEYTNADGNSKSATYSAETTASPGNVVTFDPATHDSVLAGNIDTLDYAQVRIDRIAQGLDIQRRVRKGDTIRVDKDFALGSDFGSADLITRQANFMSSSSGETTSKNLRQGETATVTKINSEDGSGEVDYITYETFIQVADDPVEDAKTRSDRADTVNKTVNKVNNYYEESGNLGAIGDLNETINGILDDIDQAVNKYGDVAVLGGLAAAGLWVIGQLSGGGGGGGGNAVRYR